MMLLFNEKFKRCFADENFKQRKNKKHFFVLQKFEQNIFLQFPFAKLDSKIFLPDRGGAENFYSSRSRYC